MFIRFRLLRDFIDKTKTDKVKYLSDIIGFYGITKIRDILRKAVYSVKTNIKSKNFEKQIEEQEKILMSKMGANKISREEDFLKEIGEKINISVNSLNDINNIPASIKKDYVDTQQLNQLNFLDSVNVILSTFENEIDLIDGKYKTYSDKFSKIAGDINVKFQDLLFGFLKSGRDLIDEKYYDKDICPLCCQSKNIKDLRLEIQKRFQEVEASLKMKVGFDDAKKSFENVITASLNKINPILNSNIIDDFKYIKEAFLSIKSKLVAYQETINKEFMSGDILPKSSDLILSKKDFSIKSNVERDIEAIEQKYADSFAAKEAFMLIKKFEVEKKQFEEQKESLELIYNEFVKLQKESLENFISSFSKSINCFYQYMNPKESFQEIRLDIIQEEDSLKGVTMKYKYNEQWVSPPQKYFSESHLNCLGLSFFLASVEAFNKNNKFIIFDDVISSFDTTHRKRFTDLILGEFSDYQIILLTHESEWFGQISSTVKEKGWIINKMKWSESEGTYINGKPAELEELIEDKIKSGSSEIAGNLIRQYLESILKDICYNLEVEVPFKFNDTNEKRMINELLNRLKSTVSKRAGKDSELGKKLIDKSINSLLNSWSHDSKFAPRIDDVKAVWTDIKEFENLLLCADCKNYISMRKYDNFLKEIKCSCGKTKYGWKK
ncbi:MAG: hypothetical protein LBR09_00030 [Endomicrobium sp.]|nr:hypothetical protein [Endomicrobium sp.]